MNPTRNPPQVIFESREEQASLHMLAEIRKKTHVTDEVLGDVSSLVLVRSEDGGKLWVQVEADKPKPSAPVAEKSDADTDDKGSKKASK